MCDRKVLFADEPSAKLSFRIPEMGCVGPVWYNNHGGKMDLRSKNDDGLVIASHAAFLEIARVPKQRSVYYSAKWEIKFSANEIVKGSILMSAAELLGAFGIKDHVDDLSRWMIVRFGGSSASQGKFLRYHDFLNIPGPGTGNDGDPNISILLDQEIKEAIRDFFFDL
jgi:hypothetical protein